MITVTRNDPARTAHTLSVDGHTITLDMAASAGGGGEGPDPHDLYDGALAACKALTMVWYANRKQLPLGDVAVSVERDASQERAGIYLLHTKLTLGGDLTEAQRVELLGVAQKCPIHKLMTATETQVTTELA